MVSSNSSDTFTYAAHKGPYLSIIGAFFFICLAEGMLVVFLVLHFIPVALLQVLILASAGLLLVSLFGKLLVPLWTSHRLSLTLLELRYGLDFRVSIPRSELVAARPVQERVGAIPTLSYDAKKQYFSLAFSNTGQVLLHLASPRTLRFGLRGTCSTDRLLISVDRREDFLRALALPATVNPASLLPRSVAIVQPRAKQHVAVDSQPSTLFKQTSQSERSETNAPLALQTLDLTRNYADIVAVEKLNLAVHQGEIYGFLGPNGAGKSTAIKMLVGLLQPTSGRAWLAGHDVWHTPFLAKRALGYVADRALLYDRLTGREFLSFLAQLRGLPRELSDKRIHELLEMLELSEQAGRLCGSYSFGMKRKLALAGALLHQPPVLILDEPLNGLDPLSSHRLKDLFLRLSAGGTTIFLSTHDLATAEAICHRVGIIQHGRLLAEGSAAELRELVSAPDLESVFLALTSQQEEVTA
jgi:ABC-type multidrug transport system ATPase subunit